MEVVRYGEAKQQRLTILTIKKLERLHISIGDPRPGQEQFKFSFSDKECIIPCIFLS